VGSSPPRPTTRYACLDGKTREQTLSTCGDHRLEAGAGSQLAHRAAQIRLDRFGWQRQPATGFGIAAAQRHLRQNIEFPGRQWRARRRVGGGRPGQPLSRVEQLAAQVIIGHLLGYAPQLGVNLAKFFRCHAPLPVGGAALRGVQQAQTWSTSSRMTNSAASRREASATASAARSPSGAGPRLAP
jgi:hypothetical protein